MAGKRTWANLVAGVAFALAIILIIWYAAVLFSAIARSQTNVGIPFEWRVVDGDTISTVSRPRKYFRLAGYDSPEITRPKCDAELLQGEKAKQHLKYLLGDNTLVWHNTTRVDRYGRALVYIWVNGRQLKDLMIEAKLGVPSDGKFKFNWCQYLKTKH